METDKNFYTAALLLFPPSVFCFLFSFGVTSGQLIDKFSQNPVCYVGKTDGGGRLPRLRRTLRPSIKTEKNTAFFPFCFLSFLFCFDVTSAVGQNIE